jgi:hypothetical protein
MVKNVRFLVRDHSPRLASKTVGALPDQWREKYGYESLVAETFVDPGTHQGTCYKAAGEDPGRGCPALWFRPEIPVTGQAKRTFDPLSIDGTAFFRSKPRS